MYINIFVIVQAILASDKKTICCLKETNLIALVNIFRLLEFYKKRKLRYFYARIYQSFKKLIIDVYVIQGYDYSLRGRICDYLGF